MLKKLKNDFKASTLALCYMVGMDIPLWGRILYYIIMLPFGLLLYPFAKIWSMIMLRRINKEMESF